MRSIVIMFIAALLVGTAGTTECRADYLASSSAYPAFARKTGGQKTRLQYQQRKQYGRQKTATATA